MSKFFKITFFFNFILLFYLEFMFFLTLSKHFYFEAFLLQPIYCLPFMISSYRSEIKKKWKKRIRAFYFIWIFLGIPFLFAERNLEIRPRTEPKYTFWCGIDNIPYNNETIETFKEMDIELIISISENSLNDSQIEKIQNLINNNIGIYVSLNGVGFANMYNYYSVSNTYSYLKCQNFYDDIKGFVIDAEPSTELVNKLKKIGVINSLSYLINNFPTVEELKNATMAYQNLIDSIHNDGKTISIVKNLEFGVYLDTALGNIYHLKLNWDSEINMHYRISVGADFRRFADFEIYDNIKYHGGEVMLGSFSAGYNEILIDITICSSLGYERIYLYKWDSFIEKYDLIFLRNMKPYKKYTIKISVYESIARFLYFHGIDYVNVFIGTFV